MSYADPDDFDERKAAQKAFLGACVGGALIVSLMHGPLAFAACSATIGLAAICWWMWRR